MKTQTHSILAILFLPILLATPSFAAITLVDTMVAFSDIDDTSYTIDGSSLDFTGASKLVVTIGSEGNSANGANKDNRGFSKANNQGIRVHGIEGHCRINQGFTLFDRTCAHRHVDDVSPQTFGGKFERCQCPGRVFVKQINNCRAGQNVAGLVSGAVFFAIAAG